MTEGPTIPRSNGAFAFSRKYPNTAIGLVFGPVGGRIFCGSAIYGLFLGAFVGVNKDFVLPFIFGDNKHKD
ncbi:hypothetical protein AKO1_012634 [Acrasis kona]|uniref:Uncharacterized protein n=1 Tax=Acrasis kona TaxID=1008807 RepID=A0AAW2YVQ6_9EUKA